MLPFLETPCTSSVLQHTKYLPFHFTLSNACLLQQALYTIVQYQYKHKKRPLEAVCLQVSMCVCHKNDHSQIAVKTKPDGI